MKKGLLTGLKIAISLGLIAWLLTRADTDTIWLTIKDANAPLLVLAFLIFFVGYGITASRWKLLLEAAGLNARFSYLIQSFSISVFFNNFLPSTVGGDAYRMYDVYKLGAGKARAIAVVFIDRVIGLSALLMLAIFASFFVPLIYQQSPLIALLLAGGGMGVLTLVWVVLAGGGDWLLARLQHRKGILALAYKVMGNIHEGFSMYSGQYAVALKALGLSFLLQINVVIHCVLIAKALSIDIPLMAMFVVVPLSYLIMTLPLSINGIGIREGVFTYFFGLFAVPAEQALAFSFVAFGLILTQGIIGGVVFMLRRARET